MRFQAYLGLMMDGWKMVEFGSKSFILTHFAFFRSIWSLPTTIGGEAGMDKGRLDPFGIGYLRW